jgi:DNA-binding transcriptional MerR regulator
MVSSRQPEDLLEPVDLDRRLRGLELTLGQACAVAGVSKMQLDYWTTKAQIPTRGRKQRLYDVDAVETVMLIKQGKDKGLSLEAAIRAAARFKAARGTPPN